MVEKPNFEYKYDLAYEKSFAARLSFRIMGIAAGVFLVAVALFFYFTGDSMTLPLTHQIVKYGTIVFVVGLTSLFVFCTWAIYNLVKPLQQFAESAISIAEGNLDADLDERAIGGLGIHLVRTIMDTVEYERTPDGYNRLVLTKGLKNKS